jgi:hypothetical protein
MPGIKIKLRPISDTINSTGVYGPKGEYPVGTIMTLPESQPLVGSGYERHEVVSKGTTKDHKAATGATSGTDDAGAQDAGQVADAELTGERSDDADTGGTSSARYVAKETSPGWFAVFEGETEVEGVAKMRKADADEFNAADDEMRAKFVAGDSGEAV